MALSDPRREVITLTLIAINFSAFGVFILILRFTNVFNNDNFVHVNGR